MMPPLSQKSQNFSFYKEGQSFFQHSPDTLDDFEDALRFQLENADYLSSFQLISESNSGFASVAQPTIQYIRDEMPKCPIFLYSIKNKLSFEAD